MTTGGKGATEYVTHRDLEAFKTEMRGDFAQLRGDFALLRGEMMEFRSEVRTELGELRTKIGAVRSALGGEIGSLRARVDQLPTTWKLYVTNVGAAIGVATLVLAAVRFA